ncbi:hypothetical protein [Leptospira langatensis]|uniref:hypothetical protein n=1 Tax=Leptospira langatensis TaxID=2484983 RepID=UPI001FE293F9|nr:hypothetical protein [Leptospira langatensis]
MNQKTKRKVESIFSKYPPEVIELGLAKLTQERREFAEQIDSRKTVRARVLQNFREFLKEYFGHYFSCEFGTQQNELIRDVHKFANKKNRSPIKLVRALSRGFGKSTILSLCAVLWLILRGDWSFVIMISSTLESAKDFLRKIVEEVEDNQKLIDDFPELNPAIDRKGQKVSWKDTDIVFRGGARIIAKGFLNAIRGKRNKQHRPSALIIDDPDEEKDVVSESTMRRKYRWFDRAAMKLGSGWGIDVLMSYTTIAPNCVGEVVFADDDKYPADEGWDKKKFKAIETDSNGKEYSTWEEGAPLAQLLKEREQDPITFAREKQNEVLAEVDQRFKGLIERYHFPPTDSWKGWRLTLGVDLSLGKNEKSDLSAIVGTARSPEGKIFEIFSDIQRRRPDKIADDLIIALTLFPWEVCGIEETGNQEHFHFLIRDRIKEYNKTHEDKILVPIVPVESGGDKEKRVTGALQPLVATKLLVLRDDSKILYKDLDEYPYFGKDGPDALEFSVRLQRTGTVSTRSKESIEAARAAKPKKLADIRGNRMKSMGIDPDLYPGK